MNWKPKGNNNPAIIRKYANFTCKFTSSTGKVVVTTGRMMIYPYPGKNCTEITTNVTGTVTTTKKCEKLENAVFCKSPEEWKLPPGQEKEDVQVQLSLNGVDYSSPLPFTIVEGLEILRVVPRCGPRKGSEVRILGKGISPNVAQTA